MSRETASHQVRIVKVLTKALNDDVVATYRFNDSVSQSLLASSHLWTGGDDGQRIDIAIYRMICAQLHIAISELPGT
eukprot:scaffold36856_cov18-Prasinocladus_malaysianus.AAC.1